MANDDAQTIPRNVDVATPKGFAWAQFVYRREIDTLMVHLLSEILQELHDLNRSPQEHRMQARLKHGTLHNERSATCDELATKIEQVLHLRAGPYP